MDITEQFKDLLRRKREGDLRQITLVVPFDDDQWTAQLVDHHGDVNWARDEDLHTAVIGALDNCHKREAARNHKRCGPLAPCHKALTD